MKHPNEQQHDDCGARILGAVPYTRGLCACRVDYNTLVDKLGSDSRVWRKSRLCLETSTGQVILKIPIVDFIPVTPPSVDVVPNMPKEILDSRPDLVPQESRTIFFQCTTRVQELVNLFHEEEQLLIASLDSNAQYPDIFTNPDAFWQEQDELRDFITGLLDNHDPGPLEDHNQKENYRVRV